MQSDLVRGPYYFSHASDCSYIKRLLSFILTLAAVGELNLLDPKYPKHWAFWRHAVIGSTGFHSPTVASILALAIRKGELHS